MKHNDVCPGQLQIIDVSPLKVGESVTIPGRPDYQGVITLISKGAIVVVEVHEGDRSWLEIRNIRQLVRI